MTLTTVDRHDAALQAEVELLFSEYIRSLDDRRFADWLGLFAGDGFYGIIRHEDELIGNHLFILGEAVPKLRSRIDLGEQTEHDLRIHLLTGVRIDAASARELAASANFAVLRDSRMTYSGQYRMTLRRQDSGEFKIARCIAVVANDRTSDLLYFPI